MRRLVRAAVAVVLVAMVVGPAAASVAQETTSAVCGDDPSAPLDVVLVLDRSESIAKTDPEGKRFEAVDAFLDGLLNIAHGDLTGEPREVTVSVVMFNKTADPATGPVRVDSREAVDGLAGTIRDDWSKPKGYTDQVAAFEEGYKHVGDNSGRCSVLVMFTDGVIDTGKGQADADIASATTDACEVSRDDGSPTVAATSADKGVTTFVLLLEPQSDASDKFSERLTATMTLFASVTGDVDLPELNPDLEYDGGLTCDPLVEPQDGEVLSAAEIDKVLANFYKIEADVGGGESAVESCPDQIEDGTSRLPAGALIREIVIIGFSDDAAGLSLDDFTVKTSSDENIEAGDVLIPAAGSEGVRLRLNVGENAELSGGWSLMAKSADEYCVELFPRTDLKASLSSGGEPIPVREDGDVMVVDVGYTPDVAGEVEFTFNVSGTEYPTTGPRAEITMSPSMATEGVEVGTEGTYRALGTDLFQELEVTVESSLTVVDYSDDARPILRCTDEEVKFGGEVPETGTAEEPQVCTVDPGKDADGMATFVRSRSADIETSDGTMVESGFRLEDGTAVGGEWTVITEEQTIDAVLENLPNARIDDQGDAVIEVGYAVSADAIDDPISETLQIRIDMERHSNPGLARVIAALVALLSAILSVLFLWVFNRLTANLPRSTDFFYYTVDDAAGVRMSSGNAIETDKLAAVLGGNGSLQLGDTRIRLVHPPVWRPFSDSIGVIEAPGPAVADPTGPRVGTVPIGFASLLIAYRAGGSDAMSLIVVVPRRGQRSGVEGVQAILADRTRIERVARQLPDIEPADEAEGSGPAASEEADEDPGGPTLPGRGPRLPG